jgi:sugar lactone lactonase YvrE
MTAKGDLYSTDFQGNTKHLIAKFDFEKYDAKEVFNTGVVANNNSAPNAPCVLPDGRILFPADGNNANWDEAYFEIDTENGKGEQKKITKQGDPGEQDYIVLRVYKHSFAYSPHDKKVYYRSSWDGALIRFDPDIGVGEWAVYEDDKRLYLQENPGGEADNGYRADGYLLFDKDEPHILYAALSQRNIIVSLNIITGEEEILAGTHAIAGWKDGPGAEALFRSPRQMVLDGKGNLIIADANNHCIRKLNLESKEVSTIAGVPYKSGHRDDVLDKSLFNQPFGVAVCPIDGSIYVADSQNRRIRKIWLGN